MLLNIKGIPIRIKGLIAGNLIRCDMKPWIMYASATAGIIKTICATTIRRICSNLGISLVRSYVNHTDATARVENIDNPIRIKYDFILPLSCSSLYNFLCCSATISDIPSKEYPQSHLVAENVFHIPHRGHFLSDIHSSFLRPFWPYCWAKARLTVCVRGRMALGAWTLPGSRKISQLEYSHCWVFPFRGHCTRAYFASGKMSKGQKRSTAYHPGARAGRFVGWRLYKILTA